MKRRLVYLIGQPGAGKSTLAARAFAPFPKAGMVIGGGGGIRFQLCDLPWTQAALLGRHHPTFPGTDTLSMGVHRHFERAMIEATSPLPGLVFGEGDRLATTTVWETLEDAGIIVDVAWLDTPDGVAADRRRARAESLVAADEAPKLQSDPWVKGRVTKTLNLVEARGHRLVRIPWETPPPQQRQLLLDLMKGDA